MKKDRRKFPSFELGLTLGCLCAIITDWHSWPIALGIPSATWVFFLINKK